MHRGGGGHQVGGAPDQPGQLHPSRAQHEARSAGEPARSGRCSTGRGARDRERGQCRGDHDRSAGHGLRTCRSHPAAQPDRRRMPGLPRRQRVEPGHLAGAAARTRRRSSPRSRAAAPASIPTSVRTPTTASPSSSSPASSRSFRSPTRRTATRAIRVRSRCRSAHRSRSGAGSNGDRHVLVLRADTCDLFELYRVPVRWGMGSGQRRPVRPALERCGRSAGRAPTPPACRSCPGSFAEEVAAGEIRHAIRVTFSGRQRIRPSSDPLRPRRAPIRIGRRWACGCASTRRSTRRS